MYRKSMIKEIYEKTPKVTIDSITFFKSESKF
jgi:hypothetical protein